MELRRRQAGGLERPRLPTESRGARGDRHRGWTSWLVRVLSVLLLALVLVEGGFRLQAAVRGDAPDHPDRSVRREWQWALDHLAAGKAVLPSFGEFDPLLGWVMRPNLKQDRLTTNSVGMRGSREFTIDAQGPRILFVGDSYTFGFMADDDECFVTVLGREFPTDWDVINLGVPAYGPDQALLMYEHRGAQYRADVVVFGFFVRGFWRLFSDFRSYAKPYLSLDGDEVQVRGVPVMAPEVLYEKYASGERVLPGWSYSYLLGALRQRVSGAQENERVSEDDERWRLMAAVLRRFRDKVREAGGEPFLLIIPNRPETYEDSVFMQLDHLARAEARRLGMGHLALAPGFAAESANSSEPLYHSRDAGGHLSARGNQIAARLLYEALRQQGLLASAPSTPGFDTPSGAR
jgi:hypothetical protein